MEASGSVLRTDYTLAVDATAGAVTMALPAAAQVTGQVFNIRKVDASANAVTLDPNGSETINGASTVSTSTQWGGWSVQSLGSGWLII